MSMKSQIKSKKQKLLQKKFSKGGVNNLIDLIQSSQQIIQSESIQKRSKYSGKSINPISSSRQSPTININQMRNLLQPKLLTMREYKNNLSLSTQKSSDDKLIVQTIQQQNVEGSNQRSLFSYKVEGNQSHFKGRISSEIKSIQNIQIKNQLKQEKQIERILDGDIDQSQDNINHNKQKQRQTQTPQPYQRKRAARYFEEENSDSQNQDTLKIVKCFRCNKKGHIAKNCFEQQPKIRCNFCQQQHHHSVCDTSPCFRCCQPGHISQDCTSKGIQCKKCHKRGHKSENCGVFMFLDYHRKKEEDIRRMYRTSDLKRLRCMNSCKNPQGHFNCLNYKTVDSKLPYEKERKSNYNQKSNFFNRR